MDKKHVVIIGVVFAAVVAGLAGVSALQHPKEEPESEITSLEDIKYDEYRYSAIKFMSGNIDFSSYDPYKIVAANDDNGNTPENIEGKKDAPIMIFEFADFQCSHCAEQNQVVNDLVDKYAGKVAVVFRTYILSYNEHGVRAASAAAAAARQGYWQKYKDLLFANQGEWYYAGDAKFQKMLEKYFETVSGGNGDLEKFRQDMKSEAVAKKVAFDMGLGNATKIEGTPTFYINGKKIVVSELSDTVAKMVEEL